MDAAYLEAIMAQLVGAFPEHAVTLVLRCPEDRRKDAVSTSDQAPEQAAKMLGEWVLRHCCSGEVVH